MSKTITMPSDNPIISQLDLRDDPPQDYLDFAKRELGEDPETRCQVLEEFRDLIYEKGECVPHRTDDAYLLRFLRAKRFVVRHAHKMLVNYYEFREDNPNFYDNVSLMDLKKVGDADLITVPPYREQTGRRIMLFRMGLWDPQIFTIAEVFQAALLVLELAITEPKFQIKGGICMFDLGGLSVQQIWYMTPTIAKQIFQIMVTSVPMRIHAVHIVNQPWVFETVYNFFKPLLNEEMRQRLFIHGENMESLHKHIDPKYLPERYRGVHPDYNYNDWIDFFRNDEKICWELKRQGYLIDKKEAEEVED